MNDDDWALCVGIEHYAASRQLIALPGARNDAAAIHAWLTSPAGGGVPDKQAKLIVSEPITDDDNALPTTAQIESFLRSLYRRATVASDAGNGFRAGRRLWLFYSGHGIGFPNEKDTGLLTADAFPPNDIPHVAGLAWAEIFRASAAFDEVILFMDCCRTEANRIPLRRPMLKERLGTPPGRMMAAYAVAESRPAFEVVVDGKARGKFTRVLEAMLRDPPERPLGARRFLELLENNYPGVDPYGPRGKKDDILLFPPAASPPADSPPPSVLIAHGESTAGLARQLAGAFRSPARVVWAGDVTASPPDSFKPIQDLVVTRNLTASALGDLMRHVEPRRTIFLGEADPGVSGLAGVRFVQRTPGLGDQPVAFAAEIERTLATFRGTLVAEAREAAAHLRVWGDDGHVVREGFGSVTLPELSVGPYRVRASLGPLSTETTGVVTLDATTKVSLPALVVAPVAAQERARSGPPPANGARREQLRIELPSGAIVLSVPCLPGWTAQVFSMGSGTTNFSVRMIPPGHDPDAPLATDATREALRLALAAPAWGAPMPTARELAGDPIALLLAAALQLRNGAPAGELVDAAAAVLGDDDVDIRLLRGGATVDDPPLLAWPWQHRLENGALQARPKSLAESIVGLRCATDPWFGWCDGDRAPEHVWLTQLANVAWPGWDAEPDAALAVPHLNATCVALGAPVASIRARLTAKSPPIDRLAQHQRAAFVGASNDQLAAALVVAFVQRERKQWEQIDVWSLTDEPLASMVSTGRTGPRLLAARDRAEAQLRDLLQIVAAKWSLHRYDGLLIGGQPHFASLWDWTRPNGYVHVSARIEADVRTSPADDLVWSGAQPPTRFTEVVRAYEALAAQKT